MISSTIRRDSKIRSERQIENFPTFNRPPSVGKHLRPSSLEISFPSTKEGYVWELRRFELALKAWKSGYRPCGGEVRPIMPLPRSFVRIFRRPETTKRPVAGPEIKISAVHTLAGPEIEREPELAQCSFRFDLNRFFQHYILFTPSNF